MTTRENLKAEFKDGAIVVSRRSDGASIRFEYDEVHFGYTLAHGNTPPTTVNFRNQVRREARELARRQPAWVWG